MALKYYIIEMFEPTILFSLFCGFVGVIAAWHYGSIDPITAALALIGVAMAQMAVNLIDDYEDYTSGIDKETVKTKFSGGSDIVVKKKVKLNYVLGIGLFAFLIVVLIGIYLISIYMILLPLAIIGGITVLFYARFLSKIPYFSEPLTALNFALIAFGCFIAAGGQMSYIGVFSFAAIAVGLQVGITVLINYMPDIGPDRRHGRKSVGIMVDNSRMMSKIYVVCEALSFLIVVLGVALAAIPIYCLLVFLTTPWVLSVSKGISRYKDPKSFEGVMAKGAMAELAFIIIMALAFL